MGLLNDGIGDHLPEITVCTTNFDFNKLMIVKRLLNFHKYTFGKAMIADHHRRIKWMRKTFEVLLLSGI